MSLKHPNILLDYVPGRCMGVFQPCNVGMQQPLKLSAKKSYHEDIVNELLGQIRKGDQTLTISKQLHIHCDQSV